MNSQFLLTILIPTYNRKNFLLRNLERLVDDIRRNSLNNKINIFISDNCSPDGTYESVLQLAADHHDVHVEICKHERNFGIKFNLEFVLGRAVGKYLMCLGDDDFIEEQYLVKVIDFIGNDSGVTCVIPSFQGVRTDGTRIEGLGRDLEEKTKVFPPSFESCLENSWRGHQMSGLVFFREDAVAQFNKRKVSNMYPSIFLLAYSSLKGKTVRLTEYPVKVTQPGQKGKDWGYGPDGLVSEIFDNYKKLFPNNVYRRFLLEMKLLRVQRWRYEMYLEKGARGGLLAAYSIVASGNTSVLTKTAFLFLILCDLTKRLLRKIKKTIVGSG